MKKFVTLLKGKKKLGYALISLLLALLFVSLLTVKARQTHMGSETVDRDTLCTDSHVGYDVTQNEAGNLVFQPTEDDPQIYLSLGDGQRFNKITIRFAEPLTQPLHVQIYYAADHEDLKERHSYHSNLGVGDEYVSVFIPEKNYTLLRLDLNGSFSPDSLLLESVLRERYYTVNWIALILLAVILTLLCVFDRRIGYVSSVLRFFKEGFARLKSVSREQGRLRVFLYRGMWVTTALYVLLLATFLLLSYFSQFTIYLMFALTVATVAFQLLYRCVSGEGNQPAKLFLVVSLLVGFMFAYCLPITSGVSWDDQIHYQRAENISRVLFGHDSNGADYDQAVFLFLSSANFEDLDGVNMNILLDSQAKTNEGGGLFNPYTYLSYFHMALIIALKDWIGIDFILQMMLIKMANILIYSTVIYFGLKKLKSGAYLMSAVCLMPTAVFMASTMTYDWWVTAFLGYAVASFISELQSPERPLTLGATVKMLAAILVGCAPKAVYFLLFMPILLLGKHKFTNSSRRRTYLIACVLVLALVMLSFVLPFFVNVGSQTDVRGGEDVNSGEQLAYILKNPFIYADTLLRFMADYTSFALASQHCSFYAYLQNPTPVCATAVLLVIMFCAFADKGECDRFKGAWRYKLALLVSIFATVAVVATALYIAFTPVGFSWINGCQWRYLVPVLFPLLYCVGTPSLVCKLGSRRMGAIVFGVLAAVLLVSFFDVYVSVFEFGALLS